MLASSQPSRGDVPKHGCINIRNTCTYHGENLPVHFLVCKLAATDMAADSERTWLLGVVCSSSQFLGCLVASDLGFGLFL